MRKTINRNAKLVIIAYILPFLCVAGALYSFDQQRSARREIAEDVFAETRAITLLNCQSIERVKKEIRNVFLETRRNAIEARRSATSLTEPQVRQINRTIEFANRKLRSFRAIDCLKQPLLRLGKKPYPG